MQATVTYKEAKHPSSLSPVHGARPAIKVTQGVALPSQRLKAVLGPYASALPFAATPNSALALRQPWHKER